VFGVVPFVHSSDTAVRVRDQTVWKLKPLSVGAMFEATSRGNEDEGNASAEVVLHKGLVGWTNFSVPYSETSLSFVPYFVRIDLVREIVSLSVLSTEMMNEVRQATRAFLLEEATNPSDWICDKCEEKSRIIRKCPFLDEDAKQKDLLEVLNPALIKPWDMKRIKNGKLPRWALDMSHHYDVCPVGLVTKKARMLAGVVIDSMRRNILPVDPPVLNAQPYLFQQAKAIVIEEMNKFSEYEQKNGVRPEGQADIEKVQKSLRKFKWQTKKQ